MEVFMTNASTLACIRIRVNSLSGRTDGFVAGLQSFLKTLCARAKAFEFAELSLMADGAGPVLLWMGDDRPGFESAELSALESAKEIDIRLNLCSETDSCADDRAALFSLLSDGALADRVQFCALITGGSASLMLSGLRGGRFCHGEVPFTDGCEGIPEDLRWNSASHRVLLRFADSAVDDAWDLSDLMQERIDEIDLEFLPDSGELRIHSVQLPDMNSVEAYRAFLERLSLLAESVSIEGALTPEAEDAFALLRFVRAGNAVTVQTAVAEI